MARHKAATVGLSHLRVTLSEDFYIGPGRADLLELIDETGSISEAAKRMGMSYKRAWSLVRTLNTGWGVPLVETARGGAEQGGTALTEAGRDLVRHYRRMQEQTRAAIAPDLARLVRLRTDSATKK